MGDGVVKMLRRASARHGVLQRAELLGSDVSRRQIDRRLKSGEWKRLLPGVYRIEGSFDSWSQSVHAASLWAQDGFMVSHRTAARLHGFEVFARCDEVHLTLGHHAEAEGVVCHRLPFIVKKDSTTLGGLQVTTVLRTLIDLAAIETAAVLERVVDEALRTKRTTLEDLLHAAKRAEGRHGVVALRAIIAKLDGSGGPSESELEHRVLELLDDAGVERPEKQVVVHAGKRFRVDFSWLARKLVIEADGYAWHSGVKSFEIDRHRLNRLAMKGFVVLRWTWDMLENHREQLVADVQRALTAS